MLCHGFQSIFSIKKISNLSHYNQRVLLISKISFVINQMKLNSLLLWQLISHLFHVTGRGKNLKSFDKFHLSVRLNFALTAAAEEFVST